jgi:hypothetical protein
MTDHPWGPTHVSTCMGSRCRPGRPSAGGEKYPELAAPDIPQQPTIALVAFYDDMIRSWREPDGKVYVVIRDYCLALGVAPQTQIERLEMDEFYRPHLIHKVILVDRKPHGQMRVELAGLDLDYLPMALASISTNHVGGAVRPKLIRYKEECAKVLRDYWFRREVIHALIAEAFPRVRGPKHVRTSLTLVGSEADLVVHESQTVHFLI